MTQFPKGPMGLVCAACAGIFVLALVVLLPGGSHGFLASVFMALFVATLAAIALYLGFAHKAPTLPAASAPPVAPAPRAPAPAPEAPAAEAPAGVGVRPSGLDAPRDGGADDLKKIKGVGPKLEKLLNSLGYWHFDQIASWRAEEVAWVDANLTGFRGRATRDGWVEQARALARGG